MTLDGAGYEVLDRGSCLALLGEGGVGRVGVSIGALPVILPVHYAFDGGSVLFTTQPDSALARATRETVIAFETDGLDDERRHWSVAVTGVARQLALASETSPVQVSLALELISGRREVGDHPAGDNGTRHT